MNSTTLRRCTSFLGLALMIITAALTAAVPAAAGDDRCRDRDDEKPAQRSALVPDPFIAGPIQGGIRTGQPYGTTLVPLPQGWVEEEFFISGTARAMADDPTDTSVYKTRIQVRRPTDPREFNGTVVIDWNNVTVPDDTDVNWIPMHRTIMKRGYAYVAVAAQRLSVEASPLALKQWDPVRYGSLNHPGDDFSFDIYSQAAEAVLDPIVFGDLTPCVARRLAVGASQSGGRLNTYINSVHTKSLVFDGFMPQLAGAGSVNRKLAPVLWLNSQSEAGATTVAADSDLFRMWEIAGPAHTTQEYNGYTNAEIVYAHTNGQVNNYNDDEVNTWGFRSAPGSCIARNWFQAKHAFSAALVALDDWVRTGEAPDPMPRVTRDTTGRLYDAHGNVRGGVRNPLLEVPIAAYFGGGRPPGTDPCAQAGGSVPLTGTTRVFDAAKLKSLYTSGADYYAKFEVATAKAVKDGMLLPEGATHLLRYAREAAAWVDTAVKS